MKAFETYIPTKLVFGAGEIARLGEFAAQYGKKAMIVTTGNDMERFGILKKATDSLERAGMPYVVFSDIEANPKDYNIDKGVRSFADAGCDIAIGLAAAAPWTVPRPLPWWQKTAAASWISCRGMRVIPKL